MRTQPTTIDGLAGPVVVDLNALTGKSTLTVGGVPAEGRRRGQYLLPTADGGTVEARVRTTLLDPYPVLHINGAKHRTGPATPMALRLLGLLPLLLVTVGGALGGGLGALGAIVNLAVQRSSQSTAVKAVIMVAVLAAVTLTYLGVVGLLVR
jgi:hypothetical protein